MNAPLKDVTDEQLMLSYKEGAPSSFEILLNRHKVGLYNFLYRSLSQEQNVEEAFQEVFIRVIRSADSYSPQAKFTTWLYTIARNYCIDQSRKNRLRKLTSANEKNSESGEGTPLSEKLIDERATPETDVSARDLASHLETALNEINEDQRQVFLLREQQGLSFEEIAQITGTSVNTVKSRMRYALAALQEKFKKLGIADPKSS